MRKDRWRLEHIETAIHLIEEYTAAGESAFLSERIVQDAVIRQIEIIGEAAKNLSTDIKNLRPDLPWREMAGTRDVLIHEYFDVVARRIWRTVEQDLPSLKEAVAELLAQPDIS